MKTLGEVTNSRNSVQEQSKEIRSNIEEKLSQQKEVRARAKSHQAQRDAIQSRIREIINSKKGRRNEAGKRPNPMWLNYQKLLLKFLK